MMDLLDTKEKKMISFVEGSLI